MKMKTMAREEERMLLIKNGPLYTMETEQPVYADLLIKNGKIAEIRKGIEETEEMEVVDVSGFHVYPGFIDAHSHIGIAEERTSKDGY